MSINLDAPTQAQKVRITFERHVVADDNPDLSFLEQTYDDVADPAERAKYVTQDLARLYAYHAGAWYMTGVRVRATIEVPIGQGSFCRYTLTSAGLWGVESDCGEAYLAEIEADQKAELVAAMRLMGAAFAELKVHS